MSGYSGHRRIRKRDALRAGAVLVVLAAALCAAAYALHRWEDARYAQPASASASGTSNSAKEPQTLTYNGQTYVQRPQLETYLLMGIDTDGPAVGNQSYIGGGQADVQMVLVLDHARETWQMLQINRDSMVEVQILGVTGQVVSTEVQQIALAHGYGDGLKRSCQNAVTAVSAMLDGQPIDGYAAINMDAVAILNDLAGGVTLTVTSDFSAVDDTLVEGETVTLQGEQALTFVRTRKDVDDQTNLARMARQRQYLAALQKQLAGRDEEFVIRAYDAIADYMVTDIGSGTAADIGEYLNRYAEQALLTIDGENTTDAEGSAAYLLDADSLTQTILTLFYEPQE